MIARAVEKLASDPVKLAIGACIVIGVVYLLARKTVKDVAGAAGDVVDAAGGFVTGKNVITKDTPYEGAGVFGTLGGAANKAIPVLDDFGSWLGGKIFDITH